MKKTLKQKLAALAVGALAVGGVTTGALALDVVAAPSASAYNTYKTSYVTDGFGRCIRFDYRDYNWYEEAILGYKDGPVHMGAVPLELCRR